MSLRMFNYCIGPCLLLGVALGGNEGGLIGSVFGFALFLTLGRRS